MKVSAAGKQRFYQELAKLLAAGFGIREAAEVIERNAMSAAESAWLAAVRDGIERGLTLAEALTSGSTPAGEFERAVLEAGERGGRLPEVMNHLAACFGTAGAARRDVARGLIHPIIAVHLGVFVGTVPAGMIGGAPDAGRILVSFALGLALAYLIGGLLWLAARRFARGAVERVAADRIMRRIPWIGPAWVARAMASYCRVLHVAVLAGIPMRETFRMAAMAAPSGMIRDAARRIDQTLAGGMPPGPVMVAEAAFPAAFSRSYATAEAAGTLDTDLARWAAFFEQDAASQARTASAVIPRLVYFAALAFVAWRILGFYQGYYGGLLEQLE